MTVRSASHPSGPSLVVGVRSVHGVRSRGSRADVGGGGMPSAVANAAARRPGCSGGRSPSAVRAHRCAHRLPQPGRSPGAPGCVVPGCRRVEQQGGGGEVGEVFAVAAGCRGRGSPARRGHRQRGAAGQDILAGRLPRDGGGRAGIAGWGRRRAGFPHGHRADSAKGSGAGRGTAAGTRAPRDEQ